MLLIIIACVAACRVCRIPVCVTTGIRAISEGIAIIIHAVAALQRELAERGTPVPGSDIPVITLLEARLDGAIAAARGDAGRETGVRIDGVSVITLFDANAREPIAARCISASRETCISVARIRIVAFLHPRLHEAIATGSKLTDIRADIRIDGVSVVTCFPEFLCSIPTHRTRRTGTRRIALVRLSVLCAIITGLPLVLNAVTATGVLAICSAGIGSRVGIRSSRVALL
jgi:hypothetical protein